MAILPNITSNNNTSSNEIDNNNNMNRNRSGQQPKMRRRMSDFSESSSSSIDDSSSHSSSSSGSYSSRRSSPTPQGFTHSYRKPVMPARGLYVGMDCEMVGTTNADGSSSSVCARVVLIDWKGRTVLDTYVKPSQPVTDYRTFVSGITAEHLVDAPTFQSVRTRVQELLHGRILVGHGLENDLGVLQLEHPWWMTRDTAYYQPFMRQIGGTAAGAGMHVPRKLKELCRTKLNRDIQALGQAHCPTEDAQAALDLYKSHRPRWEACLASHIAKMNMWNQQQQQQQQQQSYYHAPPTACVSY